MASKKKKKWYRFIFINKEFMFSSWKIGNSLTHRTQVQSYSSLRNGGAILCFILRAHGQTYATTAQMESTSGFILGYK